MTTEEISIKRQRMVRPPRFTQQMPARFPPETFERIDKVLREGEDRATFVRAAVEAELRKREGASRRFRLKPPVA